LEHKFVDTLICYACVRTHTHTHTHTQPSVNI